MIEGGAEVAKLQAKMARESIRETRNKLRDMHSGRECDWGCSKDSLNL